MLVHSALRRPHREIRRMDPRKNRGVLEILQLHFPQTVLVHMVESVVCTMWSGQYQHRRPRPMQRGTRPLAETERPLPGRMGTTGLQAEACFGRCRGRLREREDVAISNSVSCRLPGTTGGCRMLDSPETRSRHQDVLRHVSRNTTARGKHTQAGEQDSPRRATAGVNTLAG